MHFGRRASLEFIWVSDVDHTKPRNPLLNAGGRQHNRQPDEEQNKHHWGGPCGKAHKASNRIYDLAQTP